MNFDSLLTNFLYDVAKDFLMTFFLHPISRMVTLYQTQDLNKSLLSYKMNTKDSLPSEPMQYFSQIRKVEGYKGFLKGFSLSIISSLITQRTYVKGEKFSLIEDQLLVSSLYSIFQSYKDAIQTAYMLDFGKRPQQQFKSIFESANYIHEKYGFFKIQQKFFPITFAMAFPIYYFMNILERKENTLSCYHWAAFGATMIFGYGLDTTRIVMLTSMMNNKDSSKAMTLAESANWIYSTYGLKGFYRGGLFFASFITLGGIIQGEIESYQEGSPLVNLPAEER